MDGIQFIATTLGQPMRNDRPSRRVDDTFKRAQRNMDRVCPVSTDNFTDYVDDLEWERFLNSTGARR